jgi:RimJ/RimL family protein N-acetyltransferase
VTAPGDGHGPVLRTDRLIMRRWRDADAGPFAAMNADPQVMEHFPALMTRAESDAAIRRIENHFDRRGFGIWALEIAATGEFIGFAGLNVPSFEVPGFARDAGPPVEVGWRLARPAWGYGYASEAARAALAYGFGEVGLAEIISFTTTTNARSQAVMRRIGMTHDQADDFDHPELPVGSPLRRHVLWRMTAGRWRSLRNEK